MAIEPGTHWGPYELVESIGAGGKVPSGKRFVWMRTAWLAGALLLGVPVLQAQPVPGTPRT